MYTRELWRSVVTQTQTALACKALQPIATSQSMIVDGGVPFSVRCVSSLLRKDIDTKAKRNTLRQGINPFLPPEEPLKVSNISDTHFTVLNKYNVFEYHLLIVTRQYEHQQTLLTESDFSALWTCLTDYPSLGFYNGGEIAGASQPHKHLQLVPLPLTKTEAIPIDKALLDLLPTGRFHRLPVFEFAHCFYRLKEFAGIQPAAEETVDVYCAMIKELNLPTETINNEQRLVQPYNLLVSREWMMLVPRSVEKFYGISINALGYAGSFFVRKEEQIETIRKHGPLQSLQSVSVK